ncbi:MAG: hypothetical protein ACRDZ9_04360 [Acidimicrobiales bacterium]
MTEMMELSSQELEAQSAELLPDREAMSALVCVSVYAPINVNVSHNNIAVLSQNFQQF